MASKSDPWRRSPDMSPGELIIVTTSVIPGYRIKRCIGMVDGETWAEDEIPDFGVAQRKMEEKARRRGGNAVVGVRYASSTASWGGEFSSHSRTEILCYGTAVVIEPDQTD
jgi:uncharacterized protein YbjQ (UPF0145 family)